VRYFLVRGTPGVASESAYAQDSWALSPTLTVNAGLRYERYRVTNSAGATFLEISDQLAPRLGMIWDPGGDGRSKLYASFGTYHVPVNAGLLINNQAGEWTWTHSWYPLEGGILPDGTPEDMGPQIGDTIVFADGVVPDPRVFTDSDIEPMSQDELIVGFEQSLGSSWSVGARYVQRWFNEVIEDIDISRALWEVYGYEPCSAESFPSPGCELIANLRLTNPGTDFTGWVDLDGDLMPDEVAFTAEELRIPDPVRFYRAAELTVNRRFDDRWMLQGSYTWSHLEGNYGGLVNSDFGQDWPNTNIEFDLAGQMEHSRGDLPDDRRHSLKLFGSYLWDFGLAFGGSFWFASGRPINGFGMHPTDPWTQAYAWAPMNGPFSFYNNGEPCPRGCGGRTPDTWALDLTARYDFRLAGGDCYARLDVFNLFDNDAVTKVDEVAEIETLQPNSDYLEPRFFQAPRTIRFGIGLSF
jgi:outer membrane receptor protein involved in Fe transport